MTLMNTHSALTEGRWKQWLTMSYSNISKCY